MNAYDAVLAVTAACSGILSIYLYKKYRHFQETAYNVQHAEAVDLNSTLETRLKTAKEHRIAFAVVVGRVQEVGRTLSSLTRNGSGVIRQIRLSEIKTRRTHGIWTDITKILYNTLDYVPFALTNPTSGCQILVTEATEAENIVKELDVTYNNFIPYSSYSVDDAPAGEVCRGIQEMEKMLLVGTHLTGIGEILIENGHIKLQPPQEDLVYILTKQARHQVVRQYLYQATSFKLASVLVSAVAAGFLIFLIWKWVHGHLERVKMTRGFEEIRRMALTARRNQIHAEVLRQGEVCVVCLVNVREVVTLECGHWAMCSNCVQWLTYPHRCPVCRQNIDRFLPVQSEFPI